MKACDIEEAFRCTLFEANLALLIMRGRIDPLKHPHRFPHTCEWVNQCYNMPRRSEIKLSALDELLGTCGVESIESPTIFVDSYYGNKVASYLNTGDSYATTLLLNHVHSRWQLTSWGDFCETNRI